MGEDFATRDIPLGQLATPEDVANVVAFLASGLAPILQKQLLIL
ncbi:MULTISPECIES: SDR family oxidoreductase [Okeania]|nr:MULTISPECIES: SDR family oxidoreductase [Okeania]NEP04544.1 SDR family oxidoreductase [Okeania sp. SIO4D6]NEP39286.1 SDR family oxidoreductase [Okeania sp. SIO2H7]NEP71909.1 SDR family oxidoreductase [Okeania sp. SIO2G5]NEP93047.1 SDR family oxidoreductase [Okeania sp. SIO2F5]NEQ90715.1 SDR family oxidoreductase [Okeania sp. SIO2G4]